MIYLELRLEDNVTVFTVFFFSNNYITYNKHWLECYKSVLANSKSRLEIQTYVDNLQTYVCRFVVHYPTLVNLFKEDQPRQYTMTKR